ncbi:hypothetical protein NDU88_000955 [Pleurodeles waltl]|uniref:G-protein coupled receptors family 1 profile domain-containing protein n=1 Tax=Pleurodeles waltl TaxID=8319 RepID=A0AAV7LY29_PLEWA|nr:hypothetical protein NDU88_000955 [Pleurodeles waltl]
MVISLGPQLHNPMYLFISVLNIIDIGLISTTVPKMLMNIYTKIKAISYIGCIAQLYFEFFEAVECMLLAVMAYDRYVAICFPLRYPVIIPFLAVLFSHVCIVVPILKIRSTKGRSQAVSTCSSHLIVVTFFYGTIVFMYFRPSSSYSLGEERFVTIMYNVLAPTLNPLIYGLRNSEVKYVLIKLISRMRLR